MRIALFSDVHGNLAALEAVMADIEQHAVDQVVFAGDLCLMGPRPADCIDLIRQRAVIAIHGNTDLFILGEGTPPERMQEVLAWTREQLPEAQREWLARLPFGVRFSPTGRTTDDLYIVHANPTDVNQIIFPPLEDQLARYGHVRQADADLAPLLDNLEAAALVFGHLHIPSVRQWRDRLLLNISSVSMPGDGDPAAKYAVLTWNGRQWSYAHQRVAYQIEDEIAAFQASRPPNWSQAVSELETLGTYYPQQV